MSKTSPERVHIAKIFKKRIANAIEEIASDYKVSIRGRLNKTPIRIEIEISSISGEIP